ncbi:MAG: penicillin acylase family protein [Ignavibacteria bacterium]|nr:penicillin acylase family protein [Ignavibacteria bacterium]
MVVKIREWLQGTIGLGITLFVLFVCFAFFAVRLATRSHPEPYSEEKGLVTDSTFVYRNSFGIPHIIGKSITDVVFAQGYAHAQDRLWQMDAWRRLGRGTLAEVLGEQLVEPDRFMRSIGIAEIVQEQMHSISPTTKKLLTAYSAGVNAYIKSAKGDYPFEFDALDYSPGEWLPEDCLVVGRAMAFELSLAFWNDIAYAQIAAQRGSSSMSMYIPQGNSSPYVLDTTTTQTQIQTTIDSVSDKSSADSSHASSLIKNIIHIRNSLSDVRMKLGIQGSAFGSNTWAVTKTGGGAIVANDPHLSVSMPPKWYQVHLSCPNFNVVGMSVPGLPLILSGRNDSLAWGFSNAMIDDVDYVIEKIDSTNENYYFDVNDERVKFRFKRDTIKVKDKADILIDYRYTNRSCVISDFHAMKTPSWLFGIQREASSKLLHSTCLTFRWTARTASDEVLALYKMNTAKTVDEFVKATHTWNAPALNFSIGTNSGDVATVVAGIIPIRGNADPHLLAPAWDASAAWKGYVHLSTLGVLKNPVRGYVVSANNTTMPKPPNFMGSLNQPSSRAERILNLLKIYKDYTVRDAQLMQMDQISPYARRFVKRIIPLLQKAGSKYSAVETDALKRLVKWDGTESPIDPVTAIYAVTLQRFIWNTFEDELGTPLFYDWTFLTSNALRRIDELMNSPQHQLFDDVRTKPIEDMQWIAIRAFKEAIASLQSTFHSAPIQEWRYGQIHSISFPHMFGRNPLMKPVMDLGPFEIGGSATTINNTEWSIYKPYNTHVAASMRVISDIRDSIQYSVVPGGVSGQPLDAHYSDQMQLWLKGGFVRIPCAPTPHIAFRLFHIFVPSS